MNRSFLSIACRPLGRFLLCLLAWMAIAAGGNTVRGQDQASDKQAAAEAKTPEAKDDSKETEFKEETIYIPYTKLRKTFETEGRGVFLPYNKFQELWQAARDHAPRPPQTKAPLPALIAETTNQATIARDVVRVKARVLIEVLERGWHKLPLHLEDAAISSATIDGKPARIIHEAGQGYFLLWQQTKAEPGQVELLLEYAKAFQKAAGRNSVEFAAPQAPVSRWTVAIDEAGVKIDVAPLIAASDVPSGKDRSEVQAFVGAASSVKIEWTPKSEGATGLGVLTSVQTEQQVFVDENVIRTRTELSYAISRAQLPRLDIDLPADERVVNVYDPNIRRWSVAKPDKVAKPDTPPRQRISVELFEPAKSEQKVIVESERLVSGAGRATLTVPVIEAADVGRQQGFVVVQVNEALRAEVVKRTGLLQLDRAELPKALNRESWGFAYRFATVPFELSLSVEKVEPQIAVASLVTAELLPDRLTLEMLTTYTIERAGVFRLDLEIPPGYEVAHVRGASLPNTTPAQVDSHRLEGDKKQRLVVNLSRKALGRVALDVKLSRVLTEPNLLAPTGNAADVQIIVPRVAAEGIERVSGRLVVEAPISLRLVVAKSEGLRSVSLQEAWEGMPVNLQPRATQNKPVQAFAFAESPAELTLQAERRKPHVVVRQLLLARVEPGAVKYEASFAYEILYSGLKSLRIDVPANLAASLHNDTPGLRETLLAPPPPDLDPGYVAWSLAGDAELLGNVTVKLSWEKTLEKFETGQTVDVPLPHLKPRGADRAWGQIVLTKSEAIDLHEKAEPRGVRPIDPQYDLVEATVSDAARAFEFHGDWSLGMTATRYELEDVKRTSIERAVVRMVLTRSRQMPVQAVYRMRSARQRLAVKLPQGAQFDTEPLRINGHSVVLEKGTTNEYSVPLVGQNPDTPFVLELRYTLSDATSTFDLPEFPDDPAVQKVYLAVYVPNEWSVIHSRGPWTDETHWAWGTIGWRYGGGRGMVPIPNRNEADLLAWVSQGVDDANRQANAFQTDGRLYLFSTLQPEPAPRGSLRLTTIHRTALSGLVLLIIVGLGLALLRKGAAARILGAGLLLIAGVLLSVFLPMLALEIVNSVLAGAVLIVLVVWFAAIVVRRQRAANPAPAVVSPTVNSSTPNSSASSQPPPEPPLGMPDETRPTDGDAPPSEPQGPEGGEHA